MDNLEENTMDQDNDVYQDTLDRLEKLNEDRARARMLKNRNYEYFKNERITPEFLRRFVKAKGKEPKLAEIKTEALPEGLGAEHGDILSGIYNEKYKRRSGANRRQGRLDDFLTNDARESIL